MQQWDTWVETVLVLQLQVAVSIVEKMNSNEAYESSIQWRSQFFRLGFLCKKLRTLFLAAEALQRSSPSLQNRFYTDGNCSGFLVRVGFFLSRAQLYRFPHRFYAFAKTLCLRFFHFCFWSRKKDSFPLDTIGDGRYTICNQSLNTPP